MIDERAEILRDQYPNTLGWMTLREISDMWGCWSEMMAAGWLNPSNEDEVRSAVQSWTRKQLQLFQIQ